MSPNPQIGPSLSDDFETHLEFLVDTFDNRIVLCPGNLPEGFWDLIGDLRPSLRALDENVVWGLARELARL